ncbi:mobilization protein, partial [Salmonella enterica subsp. enterica serovar Typhimurium]|nr:mobilization protein [Salmonella enterica subsp. enterica serovar Typhimurium]
RISAAILDHDRKLSSAMSQRTKGMVRMVSQTWLTIVLVSALLTASGASILWWQGQKILDNYQAISVQKDTLTKLNAKTWGVSFQTTSDGRRFLVMPAGTTPEAIPYNGTTWVQLKQD